MTADAVGAKGIGDGERVAGARVYLRLVELADCGERYLGWLLDAQVNRFLETRFVQQTPGRIEEFVRRMRRSPDDYLFAIVQSDTDTHVGNLKIGPVNRVHGYADISYFIGERDAWSKGIATEAINIATRFAFERLGLHRVQAVVYADNRASASALERAGYSLEGTCREKVVVEDRRSDQLIYGILERDRAGVQQKTDASGGLSPDEAFPAS
ncbi:MAG: GNAT family N-acetyltransferase [Gemmatimonadaceae bacterium]|nr:GNAT family N-acetyltransferase [Gemmatimonadaceae bacterium]MDQ3242303.1 GNAT family N-acetyltransferase [Gemmatimonadota bacterium]